MDSKLMSSKVIPEESKLMELLKNAEIVGGIYNMGYEKCLLLTNDIWKRKASNLFLTNFLFIRCNFNGRNNYIFR